jgi:hypothetical protein
VNGSSGRRNGTVYVAVVVAAGGANGSDHGHNGHSANGTAVSGLKVNGSKVNGAKINGHAQVSVDPARVNGAPVGVNGRSANGAAKPGKNGKRVSTGRVTTGRAAKGTRNLVMQDRLLVDRCLSGEAAAWSQMYGRFHGSLLASIRAFLGRAGHDIHLVDEISARVWYSLVRNGFELLAKFDPGRGCRLSTFLSVLGKSEARLLLRSERRRKTRECVASKPEVELADAASNGALADDEFLATLSPRERAFYLDILVASHSEALESEYSQQNQWQLRHRVRRKLEQFLE